MYRTLLFGLALTVGCTTPDREQALPRTSQQASSDHPGTDDAEPSEGTTRELEDRLDRLLGGRGPLHLTHREMSLLVDSVEAGPYAGLHGVHGPSVLTTADLDGDRRPDRVFYTAYTAGQSGAAYVQQPGGGFKLTGHLDLGQGYAVCPGRDGATVHVISLVGWTEDWELVNRAGRGYGARLRVTSDTVSVEEAYGVDVGAYLSDMSESEQAGVHARLARYAALTEPRPGCVTGEEFGW